MKQKIAKRVSQPAAEVVPFEYEAYYTPQPIAPRARAATPDRSALDVMFAYYTAE